MNSSDFQIRSDMNIDAMHDGDMSEIIHRPPRSAAELNALNAFFWSQRCEWLNDKLQDEYLCLIANHDLTSDLSRKIPFHDRLSFEEALAKAEATRNLVFRAFARRGGKAEKSDALQRVILGAVDKEPNLHSQGLLRLLRQFAKEGHAVVLRVDQKSIHQVQQIHFMDNEKESTSPVSALKDRLSRARKKIKSR